MPKGPNIISNFKSPGIKFEDILHFLGWIQGTSVNLEKTVDDFRKTVNDVSKILPDKVNYQPPLVIDTKMINGSPLVTANNLSQQFPELKTLLDNGIKYSEKFMQVMTKWEQFTEEQKAAFKDFGSAVKGLIEATYTVKDMFDTAHSATKIKWTAEYMKEDPKTLLHFVNLLRRYNLDDDKSIAIAAKFNNISNLAATKKGRKTLKEDKDYEDFRFFAKYQPELLKSGHDIMERLSLLIQAYEKAASDKKNPVNTRELLKHLEAVIGENTFAIYRMIVEDSQKDPSGTSQLQKKKQEELFHSQQEADNLPAIEKLDYNVNKKQTTKTMVDYGAVATAQPWLSFVLQKVTEVMNNHHEGLSNLEAYGALGLEAYKYLDFIYKLINALRALKMDDNGGGDKDKDDRDHKIDPLGYKTPALQGNMVPENNDAKHQQGLIPPRPNKPVTDSPDQMREQHSSDQPPANHQNYVDAVGKFLLGVAALGAAAVLVGTGAAEAAAAGAAAVGVIMYIKQNMGAGDLLPENQHNRKDLPLHSSLSGSRLPQLMKHQRGAMNMKTDDHFNTPSKHDHTNTAQSGRITDMNHAYQFEKLLQTINNQQYHTTINVTPSNSDPMQVAQLVFQKFKHLSHQENAVIPTRDARQMGTGLI
ncbi:hypothetical protein [Commensalibacter oyaizuii]|uniref:Uncharacterized protein n=1 Tax=Commensalibacter oyaizuii TaxID=3043873 RepID=A0ABT6Q3I1_9PROT|nr:hypothetical protein [Commensalibacter sp. TBRC 16381]MDI2091685.1 hypothetical protein [Commensalibacter sp. TBRC 16381]